MKSAGFHAGNEVNVGINNADIGIFTENESGHTRGLHIVIIN